MRYAFTAGVLLVLLLLPINRALAGRIQAASSAMMSAKDARVSTLAQLLGGIRVIKVGGWVCVGH